MTDVQQLAEQHAEHQARAAELAAQLDRERAEAEDARQARLDEHDRAVVSGYQATEAAMQNDEAEAYEQFKAAIVADPVLSAWITYRAARWRRTHLRGEVQNAMRSTGDSRRPPPDLSYRDPRLLDDVLELAEREARRIAADEADARQAAREVAGEGRG